MYIFITQYEAIRGLIKKKETKNSQKRSQKDSTDKIVSRYSMRISRDKSTFDISPIQRSRP